MFAVKKATFLASCGEPGRAMDRLAPDSNLADPNAGIFPCCSLSAEFLSPKLLTRPWPPAREAQVAVAGGHRDRYASLLKYGFDYVITTMLNKTIDGDAPATIPTS